MYSYVHFEERKRTKTHERVCAFRPLRKKIKFKKRKEMHIQKYMCFKCEQYKEETHIQKYVHLSVNQKKGTRIPGKEESCGGAAVVATAAAAVAAAPAEAAATTAGTAAAAGATAAAAGTA